MTEAQYCGMYTSVNSIIKTSTFLQLVQMDELFSYIPIRENFQIVTVFML